jgi:hypothetical protein
MESRWQNAGGPPQIWSNSFIIIALAEWADEAKLFDLHKRLF